MLAVRVGAWEQTPEDRMRGNMTHLYSSCVISASPEIKAGTVYLQDVGRVYYVIRNYNSTLENFKINLPPTKGTKLDKGRLVRVKKY